MSSTFRATAYLLVSFCLFANLASLVTGIIPLVYARDGIILLVLAVGLCLYDQRQGTLACLLALLIFVMTWAKGITDPSTLPKIRNYCALPLVLAAVSISWDIKTLAPTTLAPTNDRWLRFTHGLVCACILAEAIAYWLIPEAQTLAYGALALLSEEKGVSVGLGGGIINGGRTMTPLLSPVQGGFVLLTILILVTDKPPFKSFFASHLLTFSKISAALGIFYACRNLSLLGIIYGIVILSLLSVGALAAVPLETLEVNLASALLHFQGAALGLMSPLDDPLGLPFLQVGALSLNDAEIVQPGFESFLGSFIAAYGVIGIFVLLGALFIAARPNAASIALMLGWLFSDNISSPHLFLIPAFYVFFNWKSQALKR